MASLQAFSKYLLVYVYSNGPSLSVPSPCPSADSPCCFGVGFVPVFSETTLEPRWGCFALKGSCWCVQSSAKTFCYSVASLLEEHGGCRCLDTGGGRTSTGQQQCVPLLHQARRHCRSYKLTSQTFPPAFHAPSFLLHPHLSSRNSIRFIRASWVHEDN